MLNKRAPRNFFLGLILLGALYMGLYKLCYLATDGFSVLRISYPLSESSKWAPPEVSDKESLLINELLSKPFRYLASGGQCYVFLSFDGNYVIKLFKFHHKKAPWYLPFLPISSAAKIAWKEQKKKKLERMLKSVLLNHKFLKIESGILYPHLGKTSFFEKKILLFDKVGNKIALEADNTAFILQKRGLSTKEALKKLCPEKAEKLLGDLIDLFLMRSKLGLKDIDPSFLDNLGIIDSKASQLDLGSLCFDPTQKEAMKYERNLLLAARPFHQFLRKNYPHLSDFFWNQVEEKIAKMKAPESSQEAFVCSHTGDSQELKETPGKSEAQ